MIPSNSLLPSSLPNVLTIAGSDPSAGAGIQADLKTFAAMNVYGFSVETLLTVQNANGIQCVQMIGSKFVRQQLDAIFSTFQIESIKIGAIGTAENVSVIADVLKEKRVKNVVLDPVMSSKNGNFDLAQKAAIGAIVSNLLPLCCLVTPNLDEAAQILGIFPAQNEAEMVQQGHALLGYGCGAILMKGGHLPASSETGKYADWLLIRNPDGTVQECRLNGPFRSANVHGTGCTLSSAIAAKLADGNHPQLIDAIKSAKHYLETIIPYADHRRVGKNNKNRMLFLHHFSHSDNWHFKAPPKSEMDGRIPVDVSLYLVLDPVQCGGHSKSVDILKRVISAGLTVVQLRAPQWHKAAILALALDLLIVCRAHNVPLLINDHVDVAMAAGADGVHLGKRDLPPKMARRLIGDKAIIGFTVNDEEALETANGFGTLIDYIGVGPVFSTTTKVDHAEVIGIDGLRQMCANARHPTVAIGGINGTNAEEIMRNGVPSGLAVASAICSATDPKEATEILSKNIQWIKK